MLAGMLGEQVQLLNVGSLICLITMASAALLLTRRAHTAGNFGPAVHYFGLALLFATLSMGSYLASDLLDRLAGPAMVVTAMACLGTLSRAVTLTPRARNQPHAALRALLDALLVGTLLGIVLWRWVFFGLSQDFPGHVTAVVMDGILIDAVVIGLVVVGAVSEPDRGLRLSYIGVGLLTSSNLLMMYLVAQGKSSWPADILLMVCWPVLVQGLLIAQVETGFWAEERIATLETRKLMVVSTLVVVLLSLGLLSLAFNRQVDVFTWTLLAAFMVAMWGRETVRARQSWHLTQQLARQAAEDPLTGLPNRRALSAWIEAFDVSEGTHVSFITLDLDGFKDVNDLLGHSTGDRLLQAVAEALVSATALVAGTQPYRMGGDEFLVLVRGHPHRAELLAQDLLDTVESAAHAVPGVGRVALGASVGVAHLLADPITFADDVSAVMTNSGHAMRASKQAGKGRVTLFEDLEDGHRRRVRVEDRLRALLEAGKGVTVHYQPIMSLENGRVHGVEALARWNDEELGSVGPSEFIRVAEESGLIQTLGERILSTALNQLSANGFFDQGMRLSVNFSTLQLRKPRYAQDVLMLLDKMAISHDQLIVEVTESVFVSEEDPAVQALHTLSRAGVGIAIDDFGTGYSSIGYLHRLPVSTLKIDQSLCAGLNDPRNDSIVRGIVEMARGISMTVILEGVETRSQQDRAYELGIQYTQGSLYSDALEYSLVSSTVRALRTSTPLAAPVAARVPRTRDGESGALPSGQQQPGADADWSDVLGYVSFQLPRPARGEAADEDLSDVLPPDDLL